MPLFLGKRHMQAISWLHASSYMKLLHIGEFSDATLFKFQKRQLEFQCSE